jgi:hypothetical protein
MSADDGQVLIHEQALVVPILLQGGHEPLSILLAHLTGIVEIILQIAQLNLPTVPFQHRSSSHSIATIPEAGYNRSMRSLTEKRSWNSAEYSCTALQE